MYTLSNNINNKARNVLIIREKLAAVLGEIEIQVIF